jgi:hypothetical protein
VPLFFEFAVELFPKDRKDWLPDVLTLLPARTSQVVSSASDTA